MTSYHANVKSGQFYAFMAYLVLYIWLAILLELEISKLLQTKLCMTASGKCVFKISGYSEVNTNPISRFIGLFSRDENTLERQVS